MNSTYIPSDKKRKLISTRALILRKQLSFDDASDFHLYLRSDDFTLEKTRTCWFTPQKKSYKSNKHRKGPSFLHTNLTFWSSQRKIKIFLPSEKPLWTATSADGMSHKLWSLANSLSPTNSSHRTNWITDIEREKQVSVVCFSLFIYLFFFSYLCAYWNQLFYSLLK